MLGLTDLQIKFGTGAGQLALAVAVAYVAWQQWQTARNKLKSELFDRRFRLVNELHHQANRVSAHATDANGLFSLPNLVREAGLVFNQDIKSISQKLTKSLEKVDSKQALLKINSEMRVTQEQALREAKSLDPMSNAAQIASAKRNLEETNALLAEIDEELKRARADVQRELSNLDHATTVFLTIRH